MRLKLLYILIQNNVWRWCNVDINRFSLNVNFVAYCSKKYQGEKSDYCKEYYRYSCYYLDYLLHNVIGNGYHYLKSYIATSSLPMAFTSFSIRFSRSLDGFFIPLMY